MSNQPMTGQDVLSMSDEDMMNMSGPPPMVEEEAVQQPQNDEPPVVEEETPEQEVDPSGSKPEDETSPETGDNEDDSSVLAIADEDMDKPVPPKKQKEKEQEKPKADAEKKPEEKPEAKPETPAVPAPINYEESYKKIIGTPFKANGKMMTVNSPEEAVALMQRGADYSKKMLALKPSLKIMKMLENNGLLDEQKLAHFIDLDKKDPAAVAKFLRDKEIDPLDLDLSQEPQYKPGNHTVSDAEMAFTSVLEEVRSSPTGNDTIKVIEKDWDNESQQRIFAEPAILKLMDVHRSSGVYDQITSEVERLKLLGTIPENTVFLDAYKSVGDMLHQHGRLKVNGVPTNQMGKPAPAPAPAQAPVQQSPAPVQPNPAPAQRQPVAAKPAAPKPNVSNSAAARAAASPRSNTTKTTPADFNPLAMSDEEFEKFEKQNGSFRL